MEALQFTFPRTLADSRYFFRPRPCLPPAEVKIRQKRRSGGGGQIMYNCSFLRWNNIHGESDIMQDLGWRFQG